MAVEQREIPRNIAMIGILFMLLPWALSFFGANIARLINWVTWATMPLVVNLAGLGATLFGLSLLYIIVFQWFVAHERFPALTPIAVFER